MLRGGWQVAGMSQTDTTLAIVTGASRGLGAAIAERLGGLGYHVLAVARTTGGLEELDDRIRAVGGNATLAPMDITQPAAMIQLVQAVLDRWGGCDLWAHAAIHAAPLAPAPHVDPKDMDRSVALNITATQSAVRAERRTSRTECRFRPSSIATIGATAEMSAAQTPGIPAAASVAARPGWSSVPSDWPGTSTVGTPAPRSSCTEL